MHALSRSRIVLPLASLMTVFALAAQAEEANQQHKGPPPGAGKPPVQAVRPVNPHPPGPGAAQVAPGGPAGNPAAARVAPGGPAGNPRVVHGGPVQSGPVQGGPVHGGPIHGGPMPARNFAGHAYRGHLAWEGGRWRHEMHNGRTGWWWDVGGVWYWYPERLEGPPDYVSDDYADDVVYAPPAAAYAPPPGAYPPPPPPPPDPGASAIGGAIVGGVLGGLLTGRASGAAAGAVIGGATGAIAGATAASRPGYWMAEGNCYYRYPDGQYVLADPRWCY
jgi:hypothetical protein